MAYINTRLRPTATQAPSVTGRLQALFHELDDAPLLTALVGPTRRGPKGHPVRVLLRCFITKHVLGLESTRALIRTLQISPLVAEACGIRSPEGIPHESALSRFFAKLSNRSTLKLLKDVSRSLVRQCYEALPAFGERVAVDSTTLRAWSNGGKPRKSDRAAAWSVKEGSQGKTEYVFGYKLHLMVDTESELPISATINPGNVHDVQRGTHLLSEARVTHPAFRPRFLMADTAYSSKKFIDAISYQYRATPVIDPNARHKKIIAAQDEAMDATERKVLYKQRVAVERAFSRLKGQRSLNSIRVGGIWKVRVHCYLSLIAMQAVYTASHEPIG